MHHHHHRPFDGRYIYSQNIYFSNQSSAAGRNLIIVNCIITFHSKKKEKRNRRRIDIAAKHTTHKPTERPGTAARKQQRLYSSREGKSSIGRCSPPRYMADLRRGWRAWRVRSSPGQGYTPASSSPLSCPARIPSLSGGCGAFAFARGCCDRCCFSSFSEPARSAFDFVRGSFHFRS